MTASGQVHKANVLTGEAATARDQALAASLATPAQVLAAVEAGHELGVAYPDSPIVDSKPRAGPLGVQPGGRIPDAGPLVRADGSPTSLRELLGDTGLQLWICAGPEPLSSSTLALARRFGKQLRVRIFMIADHPPEAPDDAEVIADPALRAHGRLGAMSESAFLVRPDGYVGCRYEPPDETLLERHLDRLGVSRADSTRTTRSGSSAI
jgi:hypothetical protein